MKYAVMSCVSFGLVQALVEWFIVANQFSGQIFRPESIFQFQVFAYIRWVFELRDTISIPAFLNEYVRPGFAEKVPLLFKLESVYSLFGLLIGALQGFLLWLIFRFRKKHLEQRNLFLLHISIAIAFSCFLNLLTWIGAMLPGNTSALIRVLAGCRLILPAVLVAIILYTRGTRLLDRLPKKVHKRFLPFSKGVALIVLIIGMPTILTYLGLEAPRQSDGHSLLSSLQGQGVISNRNLFASLYHHLFAVRSGNFKLVADLGELRDELYDLSNDPHEQHNLLRRGNHDEVERQQRILLDWLNVQRQKYQSQSRSGYREVELSEELFQELKSLGYLQ